MSHYGSHVGRAKDVAKVSRLGFALATVLSPASHCFWLENRDGRVPLGPASVLVGRSPDCDIVVGDARMSRHHALFRITEDGVEVLPLGKQSIVVNGVPQTEPTELHAGDRVDFFGMELHLVAGTPSRPPEAALLWGIERTPGAFFRIGQNPFRIGGGASDHLIIAGWPPSVVLLHQVGDALTLEAQTAGVTRGSELAVGECVPLAPGGRFDFRGQSLRLLAVPRDPAAVTDAVVANELPTAAELRFLPRGARLTLHIGRRDLTVYLPDRRCDLVATLLKPPTPFVQGDVVPVDTLIDRIWPERGQGSEDLNTLIFRTRKDLIRAEIDGAMLIERLGGGVRFCLAPGATVRVQTA